jgi:hypothetical protein
MSMMSSIIYITEIAFVINVNYVSLFTQNAYKQTLSTVRSAHRTVALAQACFPHKI